MYKTDLGKGTLSVMCSLSSDDEIVLLSFAPLPRLCGEVLRFHQGRIYDLMTNRPGFLDGHWGMRTHSSSKRTLRSMILADEDATADIV